MEIFFHFFNVLQNGQAQKQKLEIQRNQSLVDLTSGKEKNRSKTEEQNKTIIFQN
jgi:hypothetical protein